MGMEYKCDVCGHVVPATEHHRLRRNWSFDIFKDAGRGWWLSLDICQNCIDELRRKAAERRGD